MGPLALSLALLVAPARAGAGTNVLLILADDLSPQFLGASGHPAAVATPSLDSLADQGVRFTHAWSNPTCSPTRWGVFTGQHAFRHGVGVPTDCPDVPDTACPAPDLDGDGIGMGPGDRSLLLTRQLADRGYRSALFGKAHVDGRTRGPIREPVEDHYVNLREHFGWHTYQGNPHASLGSAAGHGYHRWQALEFEVGSPAVVVDDITEYPSERTARQVVAWLDRWGAVGPWFVVASFNAPHTPYHQPPADGEVATDCLTDEQTCYRAAIAALDRHVGTLLDAVDLSDTTVFFVGDNGSPVEVVQAPFLCDEPDPADCAKASLYEGSVRVPFVVAGAGVVPGVREALVHTIDLYATILSLAGALPAHPVDAVDLSPLLMDPDAAPVRTSLLTESFWAGDATLQANIAIRRERAKLHCPQDLHGGTLKLYDLAHHPDGNLETRDRLTTGPGPVTAAERAMCVSLLSELNATRAGAPCLLECP